MNFGLAVFWKSAKSAKSAKKICVYEKKSVLLHDFLRNVRMRVRVKASWYVRTGGISTSVVHRLPKPRRRVRFPYAALANYWQIDSKSAYRNAREESGTPLNPPGWGKSGQHRAPQRLTAVRQQCLVPATETSRLPRDPSAEGGWNEHTVGWNSK